MNISVIKVILSLGVLIFLLSSTFFFKNNLMEGDLRILTNQQFLESLKRSDINLEDALATFEYAFNSLGDEVTVYTSENNFYLKFFVKGAVFSGIMSLPVDSRDEGIMGWSYVQRHENPYISDDDTILIGGGALISKENGALIKKKDDWTYSVTFKGKKVIFHLYNSGIKPPKKFELRASEEFVGPVSDESGLEFFLIFDNEASHLFLVLNEDKYEPETFDVIDKDVLLARRTEFVFYDDQKNNRKILIRVAGHNTLQNNWYDGVHDNMPDNYIALGQIPKYQRYIEAAYPEMKGRIDKFGNFLGEEGNRVAVAPYMVYFSNSQILNRMSECRLQFSQSQSGFNRCITTQIFNVPKDQFGVY